MSDTARTTTQMSEEQLMDDLNRWRAATDLAAELSEVSTGHDFLHAATIRLREVLDVESSAYVEWHPAAEVVGLTVVVTDRPVRDGAQSVWADQHREDLTLRRITATRDPRAALVSDYATRGELARSPTYQECFRPSGFASMAHVGLRLAHDTSAVISVGRHLEELDRTDVALLEALRRPLASAYHRLRAPRSLETTAWPMGPALENRSLVHVGAVQPLPATVATAGRAHRPSGLTPRQRQILLLVAQGLTNHQIAHRLHLSPLTVKRHLEDSARRLGTANRTAASLRALADVGACDGTADLQVLLRAAT